MAKGAYIGVNGVAKKIKGGYIGVGGVAKKIKKAYIGVGGVAIPCFGGEGIEYYTTIRDSDIPNYKIGVSSIEQNILIAGGHDWDWSTNQGSFYSKVTAYDYNLVKSFPSVLNQSRSALAGVSNHNYALFGGGYYNNGDTVSNAVDAYNKNLTKVTSTALSAARCLMAVGSVGNYALFAGGNLNDGSITYKTNVDAYNQTLSRSTASDFPKTDTEYTANATIGNYVIFAGGIDFSDANNPTCSSIVTAYNSNLVKSTLGPLSVERNGLAGAKISNYALFAGGYSTNTEYLDSIDVYNNNLVRSTTIYLPEGRRYLTGISMNNYALFGAGQTKEHYYDTRIYSYDKNLVRGSVEHSSNLIWKSYGLSIDNIAFFICPGNRDIFIFKDTANV